MSDVLPELIDALGARAPYRALRSIARVEEPASLPRDVLAHAINVAAVLGHHDEVIRLVRGNPAVVHVDAATRLAIVKTLATAGRGDLLAGGDIPVRGTGDQYELVMYMLHCLVQADQGERAMLLLDKCLKPAVARHDLFARNAMNLAAQTIGVDDLDDLDGFARFMRSCRLNPSTSWGLYEILRYAVPDADVSRVPRPRAGTFPEGKLPLHFCVSGAEHVDLPADGQDGAPLVAAPSYRPGDLGAHVARMVEAFRGVLQAPWFAERLDLIVRLRATYAPDAGDPIQIISTGRAGTTALHDLLRTGPYAPYHSFVWQMAPRHRWEMLNRLLLGLDDPDGLRAIARRYLSARISELAAAYRAGRTPVLVSHWDVVFAPLLMAAFDGLTLVHLHRNPESVATSMIAKRQFAMGQLAPLPSRRAAPSDAAGFRLPGAGSLAEHVAWYMGVTRHFYDAFVRNAPDGNHVDIAAESLFAGSSDGFDRLRRAFPNLDVSTEAYAEHFSRKINEKIEHALQDPAVESRVEAAVARYRSILQTPEASEVSLFG